MIDPDTLKLGDVIFCLIESGYVTEHYIVVNTGEGDDDICLFSMDSRTDHTKSLWALIPNNGGEVYELLYNIYDIHDKAMKEIEP